MGMGTCLVQPSACRVRRAGGSSKTGGSMALRHQSLAPCCRLHKTDTTFGPFLFAFSASKVVSWSDSSYSPPKSIFSDVCGYMSCVAVGCPHVSPLCWETTPRYQSGQPHAATHFHHEQDLDCERDLHCKQDLPRQPRDCASRSTLSERAALWLSARLSLYLKLQPRGPDGTLMLGQTMNDATQTMKHIRLNPLHGEVSEVLLQVLGYRLSIFCLSDMLACAHTSGARQDGWPGKGCTAQAGAEGARDLSETHPQQLHILLRHF